MMKKKNYFTGSVFQFFIPEIKKYACCKFFDFTSISTFSGLLAKVYDHFSDSEIGIDELMNSDWLFGARSMHKWPDLRKDTGWKSIGIIPSPDDEVIPDFKGVQAFPYIVEDNTKIGPWYPIHNLTERGRDCSYECVRHLETNILTVKQSLTARTGMEYCRTNGLKVEDYYDIKDLGTRNMYWEMINTPVYSTIPKSIRGRAINE